MDSFNIDRTNSTCSQMNEPSKQHGLPSPSRRLQNIWSAVKRLSSSASSRKASTNEKPTTNIKFWSPFAKRKPLQSASIYSSQPNICRQSSFAEQLSNTQGRSKWNTKHLSSIGSPMKKIRKISENMQRCVHRTPSSDYQVGIEHEIENAGSFDILQIQPTTMDKHHSDAIHYTQTDTTVSGAHFETCNEDKQAAQNHSHDIDLEMSAKLITSNQKSSIDSPFHELDVHLKYAQNLIAKDSCGTSDPYVKFRIGENIVKKSRTIHKSLNPSWDEYFVLPINDIYQPLVLRVYDYDLLSTDDFLGTVSIDLLKLNPSIATDIELFLQEDQELINVTENCQIDRQLGKIYLTLKLVPKTLQEKETYYGRQFPASSATDNQTNKRNKAQPFENVVNILLIDGDNFELDTDYVIRFKLANEKAKSKTITKGTRKPNWTEQFDLNMLVGQSKMLEISVCSTSHSLNEFYHRLRIDLSELANDQTHRIVKAFGTQPNSAAINMLLTISGACTNQLSNKSLLQIHHELKSKQSFGDMSHIGNLVVKVHKAECLTAADINGKSDPFCVVELSNQRVRTCTQYKSLSPEWDNVFAFKFDDVHTILEVTVFDQDRDGAEFLGKVAIPLLKIHNNQKKWFALKDKKLQTRVKGHILLEFMISFDKIKASLRTFTPKEKKLIVPDSKFKRTLFIRNTNRLKNISMELFQIGRFLNSCVRWDNPLRSLVALLVFIMFVYFCELYMFPLFATLMLLTNYLWHRTTIYFENNPKNDEYIDENAADDFDDDKAEDKKSLKERLQTVQEISAVIMNVIGEIASFFERLKNAFNFSVPFLSWLAVIGLLMITWVLYLVPLRYLIIVWGINKFTKKFRCPNTIDNNEFLDFLSRIPDSEEKMMFKEYRPNVQNEVQSTAQPQQQSAVSTTSRPPLKKNWSIQSDRSVNSDCSCPVVRQRQI